MAEGNVKAYSVEILSLITGECDGQPVAMLTLRFNPETSLRPITLVLDLGQAVFIRDALDRHLNDEESLLYTPKDVQRDVGGWEAA